MCSLLNTKLTSRLFHWVSQRYLLLYYRRGAESLPIDVLSTLDTASLHKTDVGCTYEVTYKGSPDRFIQGRKENDSPIVDDAPSVSIYQGTASSKWRSWIVTLVSPFLFFVPLIYTSEPNNLHIHRPSQPYFWETYVNGPKQLWRQENTAVSHRRRYSYHAF